MEGWMRLDEKRRVYTNMETGIKNSSYSQGKNCGPYSY